MEKDISDLPDYFTATAHRKPKSKTQLDKFVPMTHLITEYIKKCQHTHKLQYKETDPLLSEKVGMMLKAGYNICFYGYGSKIKKVERLVCEFVGNAHILVLKGYDTSLTVKKVLIEIQKYFLSEGLAKEDDFNASRHQEIFTTLKELSIRLVKKLVLLVHCLDGPGLSTVQAQNEMAELCQLYNVQLVGTVQHCQYGMLLSPISREGFGFIFQELNTHMLYNKELQEAFACEFIQQKKVEGFIFKFKALNNNEKDLLRVMAEDEEAKIDRREETGHTRNDILEMCINNGILQDYESLSYILISLTSNRVLRVRRTTRGEVYDIGQDTIIKEILKSSAEES